MHLEAADYFTTIKPFFSLNKKKSTTNKQEGQDGPESLT